jgi:hypothetical protein
MRCDNMSSGSMRCDNMSSGLSTTLLRRRLTIIATKMVNKIAHAIVIATQSKETILCIVLFVFY